MAEDVVLVTRGNSGISCECARELARDHPPVLSFEEQDGRIARLRGYAFCPETIREIGAELGLRVRTGLYRYPTPAPGQHYSKPGRPHGHPIRVSIC